MEAVRFLKRRHPLPKRTPHYSVYPFWQTLLSVLFGVAAGVVILIGLTRSHGLALSHAFPAADGSGLQVPSLPSLPRLARRMNLLVMGVDSNGRDTQRFVSTRSDTMMLVSIDPERNRVSLVSIPRDSRVPIEGHGLDKINAAHAYGGPDLSVSTVKNAFLVQVDHYVVVDTQGLKTLFEALGPVDVLVEKPMHYTDHAAGLHVNLQAGLQTLDPVQAEEYVRYRHDARGDLGRIERQQWFLRQVARKLREPQIILKIPELVAFARDNVVTDLTAEDMVRLATFLKDVQPSQVQTATIPGSAATIGGGSYWIPDMGAAKVVLERLVGTGLGAADMALSGGAETAAAAVPAETPEEVGPISVAIKYPRGAEPGVKNLEALLNACGYVVRYKWQTPLAECQHEQIVGLSKRADEMQLAALRKNVPDLGAWPSVVAIDSRPPADFTIVISPTTAFANVSAQAQGPVGYRLQQVAE